MIYIKRVINFFKNNDNINSNSEEWQFIKSTYFRIINSNKNNSYKINSIKTFIKIANNINDSDLVYDIINDIILQQVMNTNDKKLKDDFYIALNDVKLDYVKKALQNDCLEMTNNNYSNILQKVQQIDSRECDTPLNRSFSN